MSFGHSKIPANLNFTTRIIHTLNCTARPSISWTSSSVSILYTLSLSRIRLSSFKHIFNLLKSSLCSFSIFFCWRRYLLIYFSHSCNWIESTSFRTLFPSSISDFSRSLLSFEYKGASWSSIMKSFFTVFAKCFWILSAWCWNASEMWFLWWGYSKKSSYI